MYADLVHSALYQTVKIALPRGDIGRVPEIDFIIRVIFKYLHREREHILVPVISADIELRGIPLYRFFASLKSLKLRSLYIHLEHSHFAVDKTVYISNLNGRSVIGKA